MTLLQIETILIRDRALRAKLETAGAAPSSWNDTDIIPVPLEDSATEYDYAKACDIIAAHLVGDDE